MRHEIYPLLCESSEKGIARLSPDKVLKAQNCADEAFEIAGKVDNLTVVGDALNKYFYMFEGLNIGNQELWVPSPQSLLHAAKCEAGPGEMRNLTRDNETWAPGKVLPVYTRLSDAEESEREKLADASKKNLNTGVQNFGSDEFSYEPLDAKNIDDIVKLEKELMGSDA